MRSLRWRSGLGDPRHALEYVLQKLWFWRLELMLVYLVITTTAAVGWWTNGG